MSVAGYTAQNHPLYGRGAQDSVDDRRTPAEVFDPLHERWGFTVDTAASPANALLPRYWTATDDGLALPWAGERVWCNPPYSRIGPWVVKAWREHGAAAVIVMLLPSNRTDQPWWHELVEPYRDRPGSPLTTRFLPGRVRFLRPWETGAAAPHSRPMFGCVVLTWEPAPVPAQQLALGDPA